MRVLSRVGWIPLLMWLVPSAHAATPIAVPPGNPAGNQYVETLPGPTGSMVLTPGQPVLLPPGTVRALSRQGPAGLLVLALGPRSPKLAQGRGGTASAGGRSSIVPTNGPATRPESPGAAFGSLLVGSGSQGIGWALPAILAAITGVALALVLARRSDRRSRRPSS